MNSRDYEVNFHGGGIFPTSADSGRWIAINTGTAGSVAKADGNAVLTMSNNAEIQVKALWENDILTFDKENLEYVEFDIKPSAVLPANSRFFCGVASARNAEPNSITHSAFLSLLGSNTLNCECDDNVVDTAPVAAGIVLPTDRFTTVGINFVDGVKSQSPPAMSKGRFSALRFYASDNRGNKRFLLPNTPFSLENIGAQRLQLFMQLQKASSTDAVAVAISQIRYGLRVQHDLN